MCRGKCIDQCVHRGMYIHKYIIDNIYMYNIHFTVQEMKGTETPKAKGVKKVLLCVSALCFSMQKVNSMFVHECTYVKVWWGTIPNSCRRSSWLLGVLRFFESHRMRRKARHHPRRSSSIIVLLHILKSLVFDVPVFDSS